MKSLFENLIAISSLKPSYSHKQSIKKTISKNHQYKLDEDSHEKKLYIGNDSTCGSLTRTSTYLRRIISRLLLGASIGSACLFSSTPALAEGSAQWGLNQPLYEYSNVVIDTPYTRISSASRSLYVDIISPGEVINISACGASNTDTITLEIYQTIPNAVDPVFTPTTGTQILNKTFTSNISCSDPMTGTLTSPEKFIAPTSGTYEIRLKSSQGSNFKRVDVTVTPDITTPVDPTKRGGRLHAYVYAFNAGSYALSASTSTNYFIKVPGGRPGEAFVWLLDLNNFAGFVYDIVGNAYGVEAPNSGFSVPQSGNKVTPEYPVYLSYPALTGTRPTVPPGLSGFKFTDSDGVDNTISPGNTAGVQDSGTFTFTTDVVGTYSIQIDVNQDGIYSPSDSSGNASGDVFINGITNGPETVNVPWNGRDNQGNVLPKGTYNARVQMRVGEYHFVAGDAETSGGGANNGLTIFEALSQTNTVDTRVFWDDKTFLNGTTNLPNGALSSTPEAKHTWGTFSGTGFGNRRYIDTYVYADSSTAITPVIVADNDNPPESPAIGVAKNATVNGREVTLNLVVENLGDVKLDNLNLTDDLDTVFGAGNYSITTTPQVLTSDDPGTIKTNTNFNGSTGTNAGIDNNNLLDPANSSLDVGKTATIQVLVSVDTLIDPDGNGSLGFGEYENTATVTGDSPSSTTVTDNSTDGTDPDNDPVESDGTTDDRGSGSNDNDDDANNNTSPTPIIISLNPNVLLIKRITKVNDSTTTNDGDDLSTYNQEDSNPYDDNKLDNPAPDPIDTDKWLDTTSDTSSTFLIGGINGGKVEPNDELEYTIYYLSAGDTEAKNVLFCDRVPGNVSFIPNSFNGEANKATGGLQNADRGIQWLKDGNTQSLTNVKDGDVAQYFPPGVEPSSIYPKIKCDGANTNGAVVVNLSNLPNATAPGTPNTSYGFVRFRGRVK